MNFTNRGSPSGRRARRALGAGIALVLMLLAACGKKGPLYLPDDAQAPNKAGEQTPAQPPK